MRAKDIGVLGESVAANFLKENGFRILERNRHESHNEIDIIAVNREFLLFVEVKTRRESPTSYLSAAAAVTHAKQARLLAAASQYIRKHPKYSSYQPRMDVIEVYLEHNTNTVLRINHIENAFGR